MAVPEFLVLHRADNVAVALKNLEVGSAVAGGVRVAQAIPAGHKVALRPIARGERVLKYGQAIGIATAAIAPGWHVHTHNLGTGMRSTERSAAETGRRTAPTVTGFRFQGIRRADGRVGTRNYVAIVTTVNCSPTVVRQIAGGFEYPDLAAYRNVDGLCPITHGSGCGIAHDGEGLAILRRTLGGFMRHPNVGGVLVVGLGSEMNEVEELLAVTGATRSEHVRTLVIQETGGVRASVQAGQRSVRELLAHANLVQREEVPASALCLGLQCGGSDSLSGITANPALGAAADLVVGAGGTVILAETPEVYGAEHLLVARAATPRIAGQLLDRIEWWRQYVARNGASLDNNPSPGNRAGGITTLLEKSLGAVMKAGTTSLTGVYAYAEPVTRPGFAFMDSPGYDPCSITGEIAAGANMIAFTTGRGSLFGAKPVPAVKLASNSTIAARMADDIDYDCGQILRGTCSVAEAGEAIFRCLLATASGAPSASERNGLGDCEFVPWQIGAVL